MTRRPLSPPAAPATVLSALVLGLIIAWAAIGPALVGMLLGAP